MTANEVRAEVAAPSPHASALIASIAGAHASQAVCVVARLGVADVLTAGPQSVDVIARRVGAHAPALHRLLRAVNDVGVVTELDDGRFALGSLGDLLRSDVPGSLRAWASLIGMPFWHDSWSALHDAVRTGETPFDRVHGVPFFEHVTENPGDLAAFEAGMTAMYTRRTILGDYDVSGFGTIVDVGGGQGTVLAELLSAHPHLHGVLYDAPDAMAGAEEELSGAGVADRCRLVPGDIPDAMPAGGDLYLLSGMIHGADDGRAVAILRACRAAMSDTARLLIAETVLPDGSSPSVAKLMDLQMMVYTADGRFRTAAEMRSLVDRAGLRLLRIVPSSDVVSLVEAVPHTGAGLRT